MKKLTKVIATIGPAVDSEVMIQKLIEHGVNVFRFNFKHNTTAWHSERIIRVKKISHQLQRPIAILIDLQGPEIRVRLNKESLVINKGEKVRFGTAEFSISHPQILPKLKTNQVVLADDGKIKFILIKQKNIYYLESYQDCILNNNKAINFPKTNFDLPVLSGCDFNGIELAEKNEVSYIALSFTNSKKDIDILKSEINKRHMTTKVIAKIENENALKNLDEIIEAADGVMVARGDLGVELPQEQVPYFQKIIINKAVIAGKPVITATQMLQSMVENSHPTRAEVSDVANAVYDMTDAVMLSAETATGKYPLVTIKTMTEIVAYNENKFNSDSRLRFNFSNTSNADLICEAAYNLFLSLLKKKEKVVGLLVFTHTGNTAQKLSRYRPTIPIYTFVPNKTVSDRMALYFGVKPFIQTRALLKSEVNRSEVMVAINILKQKNLVHYNQLLIVVHGDYWTVEGGTSTVKLIRV